MKKINLILCTTILTVLIAGCGNNNSFTINGTVSDPALDGEKIYVHNLFGDPEVAVDSCTVANGKYTLNGTVDEPWIALLKGAKTSLTGVVVVEPGTVVINDDSIGGTPMNDRLLVFNKASDISDIFDKMEPYMAVYYGTNDANERATAERMLDSLDAIGMNRMSDASWKLYNENHDNVLARYAMQVIIRNNEFTYSEFDSIISTASPMVADDPVVQATLAQLRAVEETSEGKHYTDIQGVDGKLSDLIDGKVALVDFYASWCGPCRNEIKDNLVPLWKKYQGKGLVIVGLNVWERGDATARKAAHEKVMADLGITYPQLVDSTRTATDTYGVRGIPQIILIDKDGTILARDLRGAAIEDAIVKALGK